MTYQPAGGFLSTLNSTSTPLGAGATFSGAWEATNGGGTAGTASVQYELTLVSLI